MNTTTKGRVVELITAAMHRVPKVNVQTNVFLPSRTDSRRKREIDVLLTSEVAGYPIRFAIECKNERSPIGTVKIDQFIGKLKDLGIPIQHGIFVSASGYRKTGLARAIGAGLKPLTLRGLTKDGLAAIVAGAFQAIVFLLPVVTNITVVDNDESADAEPMPFFVDSQGNRQGWMPDLIWQDWLSGTLPSSLGDHELPLTLPSGWQAMRGGRVLAVTTMAARIRVLGLVISLSGQAEQYSLLDEIAGNIEKTSLNVAFDIPSGKYPVATFHTEDELASFLNTSAVVKVVQRIRLPRINCPPILWPPSERVHKSLLERFRLFQEGKASWDPSLSNFAGIEGNDLQDVFEPIWENHPLIRSWRNAREVVSED
jgi:hypothetical protein